jgi:hypothetical protein
MIRQDRKNAKGMSSARKVMKIDIEAGVVVVYTHDGGIAALMGMKNECIEMRGCGVVMFCRLTETEWGLETRQSTGGAASKAQVRRPKWNGDCAGPSVPFLYKDL